MRPCLRGSGSADMFMLLNFIIGMSYIVHSSEEEKPYLVFSYYYDIELIFLG